MVPLSTSSLCRLLRPALGILGGVWAEDHPVPAAFGEPYAVQQQLIGLTHLALTLVPAGIPFCTEEKL